MSFYWNHGSAPLLMQITETKEPSDNKNMPFYIVYHTIAESSDGGNFLRPIFGVGIIWYLFGEYFSTRESRPRCEFLKTFNSFKSSEMLYFFLDILSQSCTLSIAMHCLSDELSVTNFSIDWSGLVQKLF